MSMWNGETLEECRQSAERVVSRLDQIRDEKEARAQKIDEGLAKFREARRQDEQNGMGAINRPDKREALLRLHGELTQKAYETMIVKNNAYATTGDPYRNFRTFGLLGVLVRLSDKLSRLQVFVENGFDGVADESVSDTVQDGINYLVLFDGLRRELSDNVT